MLYTFTISVGLGLMVGGTAFLGAIALCVKSVYFS